jgi:hypothetical protein
MLRLCGRSDTDFVGPDGERLELIDSKRRRQGNIGGITTAGHEHAPDAGNVVTRVKRVPLPAQECLEPRAEIHRAWRRWQADIAQIAGAIARGHIQAAAQGDREVREIAAYTRALMIGVPRRSTGPGLLVVEPNMAVHEIADCLNPRPTRLGL